MSKASKDQATKVRPYNLLTEEFIEKLAAQNRAKEYAEHILWRMNALKIKSDDVPEQCNAIIHSANVMTQEAIDFMLIFFPEEVMEELDVKKITGAFATDVTGKASMHAELTFHLDTRTLKFPFDVENFCFYDRSYSDDPNAELLSKHFKKNHGFDAWVNVQGRKE